MADYAYGIRDDSGNRPTAPPELVLALDWERFHTPPIAGGLLDQPLLLLFRMRIALNVYCLIKDYRLAVTTLGDDGMEKWYSLNDQAMELLQYVWRLQGVEI